MYPLNRPQRLRQNKAIRDLLQETVLTKNDFILPIFIHEGITQKQAIKSLPGVYQFSLDTVLAECEAAENAGIKAVMLFGIPVQKDPLAKEAYNPEGIMQKAIQLIKHNHPNLLVIADCCLCEYTDHGHCGIMTEKGLDNDSTVGFLNTIASSYAQAGVDIIAPSGMMDGMVVNIRNALDSGGHTHIPILSYAVKFASSLYGPFREAAGSEQFTGNRQHHQLNPAQKKEALNEALLDIQEGADMLMVKPATLYTDIISTLSQTSTLPIAAYHVSGEYAMIKAAAQNGWIDEYKTFEETYISLKRAGATLMVSYYAKEMASSL